MPLLPVISVNGVIGAQLSPLDRGFAYGDGLFETCKLVAGRIPLLPFHLERLHYGCERLRIPLDFTALDQYLRNLLAAAAAREGVVKISISRGEGGRGYRVPEKVTPTYCLTIYPATLGNQNHSGVTVRICAQRLSATSNLAGLKHLNRLENVLARAEWSEEYIAEGLLLNEAGNVIEATASNFFIIKDGELITPDLSRAGVAGVMRRIIIEQLAPRLHIPVRVENLTLRDLYCAGEIFLCNSVFGIWPVLAIVEDAAADIEVTEEMKLKEATMSYVRGPFTVKIQQALENFLRTKCAALEVKP